MDKVKYSLLRKEKEKFNLYKNIADQNKLMINFYERLNNFQKISLDKLKKKIGNAK
jgi:hypothetical protein